MVAVSLQLCLFFCLGWLIVSPGVATEQEEVNDTDQSRHLVQHEIVTNGKNSKEDNLESAISSNSRKLTAIISPRRNRSRPTWHQNDYLCDIQHALDTVRALADHRMSLETILRICSIRTGFLANRKLGSTRVLRRIERDAILPQQSTIYFNNPKHLKRILNILRQESKLGTENHTNRLGRLSKISKRSTDGLNEFAEFKDKRQPLDRIDEPSEWRDKLRPKYARFFEKRQPLDRIDEPSEWRDKLQPKYARFFEKRQP